MKPIVSITLICILTLFTAPLAVSQELPSFEELLEKMAEALSTDLAWSADMEMTMNMMGMEMKMEGSTTTSGTKSVSTMTMNTMGMPMEMNSVLGADGIQWTSMNVAGQPLITKMDMNKVGDMSASMMGMSNPMGGNFMDMMKDPKVLMEMYDGIFDMKVTGIETQDGIEVYMVEGAMVEGSTLDEEMKQMMAGLSAMMGGADGASFMSPMKFTIGVEDGLMRTMSMGDVDGKPVMAMTIKNVKTGIEVDDSIFTFTPPEGAAVMDLTEMMPAGLEDLTAGDLGAESADEPEYNAKLKVGDMAPAFEGIGPDGSTVKLSDYKGKVVLLDFWATWCGPCIQELPNVLETYEKYHSKGLEIVGISLDNDKKDLEEFVAKRPGMTWAQIYDGKGWDSVVGKEYGVDAIPFTLLLDGEGKIVARDLHGEALGETVADLLGESE